MSTAMHYQFRVLLVCVDSDIVVALHFDCACVFLPVPSVGGTCVVAFAERSQFFAGRSQPETQRVAEGRVEEVQGRLMRYNGSHLVKRRRFPCQLRPFRFH